MQLLSTWHAVTFAWLVFLLYWAISAAGTKPTLKGESIWGRAPQMFLVVLGAVLLFNNDVQIATLNRRFVPEKQWSGRRVWPSPGWEFCSRSGRAITSDNTGAGG